MKDKIISFLMDSLYLFIGISATVVSVIFSYRFLIYNGHGKILSSIIAIMYMLFLNLVLFEIAINNFVRSSKYIEALTKYKEKSTKDLLKRKAAKRIFIGSILLLCWFLLVSYSIVSTVGGQYDQLSKLDLNKNISSDIQNNDSTKEVIENKINILTKQKLSYEEEISNLNTKLSSMQDLKESAMYRTTVKNIELRIDEKQNKVEEKDNEILDLNDQLLEFELSKNKIVKGNTYEYFYSITKIPAFVIQFVLSFFPSIVIDFFAPIAFAMFLFRKRKDSH